VSDYVSYIDLAGRVSLPLPPLPIADMARPASLARMRVPLREARIMLVASAGVHVKSDPPFAHANDLTFRRIAQAIDPKTIRPSHPSPIRRPGLEDINVVFPYQRLDELAEAGVIGGPTANHVSMQGAIKRLLLLTSEMAPAIAEAAREEGADAVLLIPL
jgi:D-proline reductase (dithiol) PrdB